MIDHEIEKQRKGEIWKRKTMTDKHNNNYLKHTIRSLGRRNSGNYGTDI